MSEPILSVRALARSFDGVPALAGADFDVPRGTITALIGPNGAGKTTACQCISGVLAAQAGRIVFAGRETTGWAPPRISRAGLVRTFQIARGIPRLSVLENLLLYAPDQPGERMWAALVGAGRAAERRARERAIAIARRLALLPLANRPAGTLSGGQRQVLAMAMALMVAPRLLLLDEPSAGHAPRAAEELFATIGAIHREGTAIVMVEQNALAALTIAERGIVMVDGRAVRSGPARAMAQDAEVRRLFLGG